MSILGIGIDMVKVSRMETLIQRWDRRFLDRVFTGVEQDYCLQKPRAHVHFSGRFAMKEAVLKAIGTGLTDGVSWKDIETQRNVSGLPVVHISGRVHQLAGAMGVSDILGSITHDHDYAIAQVILQGNRQP